MGVTVEVKKRRVIGKSNNKVYSKKKFSIYTNKPSNITNEEWDKRLNVLKQANKLKAYEEEKSQEKSKARSALMKIQIEEAKNQKKHIQNTKTLKLEKDKPTKNTIQSDKNKIIKKKTEEENQTTKIVTIKNNKDTILLEKE